MSERFSVSRLRAQGRRCRDRVRVFFRPVCILSGVYILAISAIIRANMFYCDDFSRAFEGRKGWGDYFGRYLSDLLSNLVHADTYLTDVSPLPQLIACVVLAVTAVIVLRLLTGRDRFTVWEYAATVPLALSPYMLECLCYKYDAPYMALSVLFSAAPLLLADASPLLMLLGSFAGTLAMCNCYQASAGILPVLTALLAFKRWYEGGQLRDQLRFIAAAAAGYIAAIVLFRALFVQPVSISGNVSTFTPSVGELLPAFVSHLRAYYELVLDDLDVKWLALMGVCAVCFVWTAVRDSVRSKPLTLLLALAAAAFALVFAFGLYPALDRPVYYTRTMFGFSACMALLAVFPASAKKVLPAKLACLALAWCFFVFSFTLGNALYMQKTYTRFRVEETIQSIKYADAFDSGDPVVAQISGSIGYAPSLQGAIENCHVLKRLIPVNFDDSWEWGRYGMQYYYGIPSFGVIEGANASTLDLRTMDLPVLDETIYHVLRGNDHFLLIELK